MANFSTDFTTAQNVDVTQYNPGFTYLGPSGIGLIVHTEGHVRDQSEQGLDIWVGWNGSGAPTGNQRLTLTIMASNTGQAQGFVFVLGSATNGYNLWRENGSTYQLYRRDNGGFTPIGSPISVSTPSGTPYTVSLEAEVQQNQTILRYNINGTQGQIVDNSAQRLTSGIFGGGVYNPGAGQGAAWFDDFNGEDLTPQGGEPFELEVTAPIGISGTVSVSGDLAKKKALTPTGPIAVNGQVAVVGDVDIQTPTENPFNLVVLSPIGINGQVAVTADIEVKQPVVFELEALNPIGINGTVSVAGDIAKRVPWFVEQPFVLDINGVVGVSGDIEIKRPTANPFNLQPTGPIAVNGTVAVAGNLAKKKALTPTGPIAVNGQVAVDGDIAVRQPVKFDLEPLNALGINGQVSVGGGLFIGRRFNLQPTGPIGINGYVGVYVKGTPGEPDPGEFWLQPPTYPSTFTRPAGCMGPGGMMGM